jgi:hypothetical protein
MATKPLSVIAGQESSNLHPVRVASFPRIRALAWRDDALYASAGYTVIRTTLPPPAHDFEWSHVGRYKPAHWRTITSSSALGSRVFRDGFHALAVLSSGDLIGAVPRNIVTLRPGETTFSVSHKLLRGTRPLHFATTPYDHAFWGEYFDNPHRDEVHIYGSTDRGAHWDVAYTFLKGAIRHVHNIVYDEWGKCFWVLTGDRGSECRILRASCDFRSVEMVLSGNQQTRSAALVPTREALYFSTDTPFETNHVYRLDRQGNLAKVAALSSSSIYGCRVGGAVFFSTMIEPSSVNTSRDVRLYGSADCIHWQNIFERRKDSWPMTLFQYGNAFLPDGENTSGMVAVTNVAVQGASLETTLWRL